jgi:hypothetical protein
MEGPPAPEESSCLVEGAELALAYVVACEEICS